MQDDDTPVRPPPKLASDDAAALVDVQLALLELARDSGQAAAGIDGLEAADRAHVLPLYRRRLEAVSLALRELLDKLPKA